MLVDGLGLVVDGEMGSGFGEGKGGLGGVVGLDVISGAVARTAGMLHGCGLVRVDVISGLVPIGGQDHRVVAVDMRHGLHLGVDGMLGSGRAILTGLETTKRWAGLGMGDGAEQREQDCGVALWAVHGVVVPGPALDCGMAITDVHGLSVGSDGFGDLVG